MSTPKDQTISRIENILIVLHGLIIILFIGYEKLAIPIGLALVGRLHPLILHFPLVILLCIGVLYLLPIRYYEQHITFVKKTLLFGLIFCGITALAGIFLSKESGYEGDSLQWHLWTGLAVFWIGSLLYIFTNFSSVLPIKISAFFLVIGLLVTGHLGASLTHGDDFLFQPLTKLSTQEPQQIDFENAEVYLHAIKPIFDTKCVSCHKASKQKGELRLDDKEFILTGGKSGSLFDFDNLDKSLFLHRIFLPMEDDEHMPPKGKNQLTENEIKLLQLWIADSLPFETKIADYAENSEIYQMLSDRFNSISETKYSFTTASPETVNKLTNFYRKIEPISPSSPALSVSFYGKNQFSTDQLKELKKIKDQVVILNLNQMPLTSTDLKILKEFKNLEKLYLNFTGIEDIENLNSLSNLKVLSISGNKINKTSLLKLKDLKKLDRLFAWNCDLETDDVKQLKRNIPSLKIELGYKDDGKKYPLNPPKIQFDQILFKEYVQIELKHPIKSTKLYYTLDGTSPDSINKILYSAPIKLTKSGTLRAIATAEGWDKSSETNAVFLKAGIKPDKYKLVFEPHSKYKGFGVENLFDYEKGDLNFGSGKWLGFTDNNLEVIMDFDKPKSIEKIGFSILTDEASYIFSPLKLEVWFQEKNNEWKLLDSFSPLQPNKMNEKGTSLIELKINKQNITKLKAIAIPVQTLPNWHPGSGQKSWVFIDEIVLN